MRTSRKTFYFYAYVPDVAADAENPMLATFSEGFRDPDWVLVKALEVIVPIDKKAFLPEILRTLEAAEHEIDLQAAEKKAGIDEMREKLLAIEWSGSAP